MIGISVLLLTLSVVALGISTAILSCGRDADTPMKIAAICAVLSVVAFTIALFLLS